jgi:Sulfotransferase family
MSTGDGSVPQPPILVTGAHCSGTTWVGRMIASHPALVYIHEPFKPKRNKAADVCGGRFSYWFTYVCERNESRYYKCVQDMLSFRFNWRRTVSTVRSRQTASKAFHEWAALSRHRHDQARPLVKDPIAIFSAPWLASRFNMAVVVMIRHPAAFAASLKRRDWTHPFSHFLLQPLLMDEHLRPYESEIRALADEPHDIIDQAALLWKMIHHTIAEYREQHPGWIFVRHEDLSRDPLGGFQAIFDGLGLEFTQRAAGLIQWHSGLPVASHEADPSHFPVLRRDSASSTSTWKREFTPSEIQRIRSQVQGVSEVFYSDEEW